jgi:hypothetical protein
VAWLSLDEGDNDPARFWRHAVAALDRVRPGIAERAGPLLGPQAPSSFEGLVTFAPLRARKARRGDDGRKGDEARRSRAATTGWTAWSR